MNVPDSFVETKYYIKFSNIENYTDVSGTVEEFAVTKAGKIPLVKRNRDYTLQIMNFSFNLYSTRQINRGQKFKATRTLNGVEKDLFFGFVDDVSFDENKNEYNIKIAHEFKLLQRYNIRKSELESILTESNASRVIKKIMERVLDRDVDFSIAETYKPFVDFPGTTLLSATFYMPMFYCSGLDIATSSPDEDATATYWDVISETFGLLGCIIYFDGIKYIVKHHTQDTNYDFTLDYFFDKYKESYIPTKEFYNSCGFTSEYNLNLTTYTDNPEFPIVPPATEPEEDFSLTTQFEYDAIIKNFDVSLSTPNLKTFLTFQASDRPDILNIGRIDTEQDNQKLYLDDYYKQAATIDYDEDHNVVYSKDYDPVNDNMNVEQHIPYDFKLTEYYYYDLLEKKTLLGTSELNQFDSVYVSFNKELDENSLTLIEIRKNGLKQVSVNKFMSSATQTDSKTIRLQFSNLPVGSYNIYIYREFKSITQRKIPIRFLGAGQLFKIVAGGGEG